jgi:hypothetical protein
MNEREIQNMKIDELFPRMNFPERVFFENDPEEQDNDGN